MVYVMFVVLVTGVGSHSGGMTSFQYEFKDKIQCENAVRKMKKNFLYSEFNGYCQEVRK